MLQPPKKMWMEKFWNGICFSGTLEYANCSLYANVCASCEGDLMVPGYPFKSADMKWMTE